MRTLLAAFVVVSVMFAGCSAKPPVLTPQATLAFNSLQIEKALDLIRDTAQAGAALNPPIFTVAGARTVTLWHEAAIKVLYAAGNGWQVTVSTTLTQLPTLLTTAEAAQITPYIALAQTLLQQGVL
jgi:hypothetical protein